MHDLSMTSTQGSAITYVMGYLLLLTRGTRTGRLPAQYLRPRRHRPTTPPVTIRPWHGPAPPQPATCQRPTEFPSASPRPATRRHPVHQPRARRWRVATPPAGTPPVFGVRPAQPHGKPATECSPLRAGW